MGKNRQKPQKKELKKLRNKMDKTLGEYLRKPDTTLAVAERACLCLHRAIEETYRNNFKDVGKSYSSEPIILKELHYGPWEKAQIEKSIIRNADKRNQRDEAVRGRIQQENSDIGWHWCEMMKNMFFSLLKQASDDDDASYEKMVSWIRHIPENSPFRLNMDELGCFDFAVMQSVPVEDEDALEEDD